MYYVLIVYNMYCIYRVEAPSSPKQSGDEQQELIPVPTHDSVGDAIVDRNVHGSVYPISQPLHTAPATCSSSNAGGKGIWTPAMVGVYLSVTLMDYGVMPFVLHCRMRASQRGWRSTRQMAGRGWRSSWEMG